MKKVVEFPTLFDTVNAVLNFEQPKYTFHNRIELRKRLYTARRFVLDDSMSAFLADVSCVAFKTKTTNLRKRAIEAMRTGARLPHKYTWIEYNLRTMHERLKIYNHINKLDAPPEELPKIEGWLLEQHPQLETAF